LNGIIDAIEKMHAQENPKSKDNLKNAKLWEQKLNTPGISYYIKKGGSVLHKN